MSVYWVYVQCLCLPLAVNSVEAFNDLKDPPDISPSLPASDPQINSEIHVADKYLQYSAEVHSTQEATADRHILSQPDGHQLPTYLHEVTESTPKLPHVDGHQMSTISITASVETMVTVTPSSSTGSVNIQSLYSTWGKRNKDFIHVDNVHSTLVPSNQHDQERISEITTSIFISSSTDISTSQLLDHKSLAEQNFSVMNGQAGSCVTLSATDFINNDIGNTLRQLNPMETSFMKSNTLSLIDPLLYHHNTDNLQSNVCLPKKVKNHFLSSYSGSVHTTCDMSLS